MAALGEATALKRIAKLSITSSDMPVLALGGIALILAIRGTWDDPSRPYISAGVSHVAVSLATGLLAMQLRMPGHVFISGLLVNLAGFLAWVALGTGCGQQLLAPHPFVSVPPPAVGWIGKSCIVRLRKHRSS